MRDGLCKIGFGYRNPFANISEFNCVCMCEEVHFKPFTSCDKYPQNDPFKPCLIPTNKS